jgi:hypothetical protein
MNVDQEEIEATKSYILSLCSAIGGLEEIIQADGTVGQVYCVGDEALGIQTTFYLFFNIKTLFTSNFSFFLNSLFKIYKKSYSCR